MPEENDDLAIRNKGGGAVINPSVASYCLENFGENCKASY